MRDPDVNSDLDVADTLRELTKRYGSAPNYARFWKYLIAAKVPARRYGRQWFVKRADLPAIAELFGLTDSDRAA